MEEKLHIEKLTKKIGKVGIAVKEFFQGGEIEAVNFELQWPPRVI